MFFMKTKSIILLLAAISFCSLLILQYGCKKDEDEPEQNKPPTAVFTIDPTLGPTSTIFEFDASGCIDPEEPISVLKVRWDWENNGNWDTDWSNDKTKNHQYSSEDTYTVKMEVKDTEGLTDNITHSVTVKNSGGSGCQGITSISYQGKIYNTVEIGDQCWLKENMNYASGNSWCYHYNSENCEKYGRLYDWETALGVCPPGWHLPSDDEWCTLTTYIDPTVNCNTEGWSGTDVGYKIKSTSGWFSNGNGSDEYGFMALPGGYRSDYDYFDGIESGAYFWSSTEYNNTHAWERSLYYYYYEVYRNTYNKDHGRSVRCVKD
jgi:uncharacterized protein (TIGR02145 family)